MRDNHKDLHDLLHRIADRDALALAELDLAIRQPLLRYLTNRFSPNLSNDDAEDVIQYTLIQIWRYAPTYRGRNSGSSARRWIFDIAKNRSLRVLKSQAIGLISMNDDGMSGNGGQQKPSSEYKFS